VPVPSAILLLKHREKGSDEREGEGREGRHAEKDTGKGNLDSLLERKDRDYPPEGSSGEEKGNVQNAWPGLATVSRDFRGACLCKVGAYRGKNLEMSICR